ncbi:MAG: NUDIX domain-containing protein [Methanosarcina barkeri]|nr:NUDIX domain-containing protein [Methanosarcina sp. ERenArc_MAG2]
MNLEKSYIISVYAILRDEKGKFLLLRRSENSHTNPGKWDLPGETCPWRNPPRRCR